MNLLKQPNRWSCLPTAFAMAVDCTLDEVLFCLGHDGSAILWPTLPESQKRRAFHIEELQYVAFDMGWCLVPYISGVNYCPTPGGEIECYDFRARFRIALNKYDGLLLGSYVGSPNQHAVAWNAKEQKIYDPSFCHARIEDFNVESFYAAVRART